MSSITSPYYSPEIMSQNIHDPITGDVIENPIQLFLVCIMWRNKLFWN